MSTLLEQIPIYWGTVVGVLLFVVMIVVAFFFKREYIYREAPSNASWRDLRFWALGICLIQIVLYLIFS